MAAILASSDLGVEWSGGLCLEMEIGTKVVPLSQYVADHRRRWRFWLDLIWAWSGGKWKL